MNKILLSLCCMCFFGVTFASSSNNLFIYHGNEVKNDQMFPYVVAIYNNGADPQGTEADCTGTVVGSQWILTASHCVVDEDGKVVKPSDLTIGTGFTAEEKGSAESLIPVTQFYTYNNAGMDLQHDVALLKLSKPVNITPVQLPTSPQQFPKLKSGATQATAVGFGWTDVKKGSWSPQCKTDPYGDDCTFDIDQDPYLLYGDQVIQTDANTMANLKPKPGSKRPPVPIKYNAETMLGTISPDQKRVTNGDSGGPLLTSVSDANGNTHMVEIGINSWGIPVDPIAMADGSFGKEPSVFVNLSDGDLLKFINDTMKGHS